MRLAAPYVAPANLRGVMRNGATSQPATTSASVPCELKVSAHQTVHTRWAFTAHRPTAPRPITLFGTKPCPGSRGRDPCFLVSRGSFAPEQPSGAWAGEQPYSAPDSIPLRPDLAHPWRKLYRRWPFEGHGGARSSGGSALAATGPTQGAPAKPSLFACGARVGCRCCLVVPAGRAPREGRLVLVAKSGGDGGFGMAHHKRKKPKSTRSGCLMCKSHKHQRTGRLKRQRHSVQQKLLGDDSRAPVLPAARLPAESRP